MKTTFLTLIAATLAVTTLTGCKKDSGDDDSGLKITRENVSLAVGDETIVRVYTSNGLNNPQAKNVSIAVVNQLNNSVDLKITGKSAGITSVELTNYSGDRGTITINVIQEDIAENGGFKVDKSTIFLKKGGETDVTGHIKGGSGNYDVTIGNSTLGSVRKVNGKFIVTGLGEGLTDKITFKDLTLNKTVEVEAYVIVPFKALISSTELVQNSAYNITLEGVYTTTTPENGRFDRMQMNVSGNAVIAQFITTDVKAQNGVKLGEKVTGIRVTAKNVGTGTVNLINGDGQTLSLNFTVKALVADNYFNVDADGVLTVKRGVTLPSHIVLPANAKKIAEEAFFKNKNITSVDFKNVEEIGKNAFQGCTNLTTITMTRVKVIGQRAFDITKIKVIDLPSTIERIEDGAFNIRPGVNKLNGELIKVTCRATTPPILGANVFSTGQSESTVLYVPAGSIDTYVSNWNREITRNFQGLISNGYKPLPIQ
ncbi:leucine-rich repeat domain-containing protein [Capnocytophaga sputigena]|uniref:leucine-rich repeat domain-containing protein n=1 Tax=Capnocytophaga sputigena TaxID=1019 RepID=UPI0028EA94F1|nr:leucine-rich repeat domain-containing protein [Capnocytophaga sputigena]